MLLPHRGHWFALLCLLVCCAGAAAHGADPVGAPRVEFLADPGGRLTLDEVSRLPDTRWTAARQATPNFGYTSIVYWFRTTLRNDSAARQQRLYEIAAPLLDQLDLHLLDEHGRALQQWALGDKHTFDSRPLPHRHFVVPIEWAPRQTLTMLARVATEGELQMPVRLWTARAFEHQRERTALALGIYFGLMLAMLASSLLLYLVLRDISHLWYAALTATLAAFAASLTGLSFQYLWPQATTWNDTAIVFFMSLALACACQFTRSFLALSKASQADRLMRGFALVALVGAAATLAMPYAIAVRGVSALVVLLAAMGLAIAALRLRDGFAPARHYLMGWSLLLGGPLLMLSSLAVLPIGEWASDAALIGSAIGAVLLSIALAARLNNDRQLRAQAQAETLRCQREANERLEDQLGARTIELEHANAQLHELSQTDGLTGVHNRRHLEDMLVLESQRAHRVAKPLGIILIDIDHFKRLNDEHGHAVGDECLKQVARTIRQHAKRSTDLVARYGGEEFCAVMPGLDAASGLVIAERLRKQVATTALEVDGRRLHVTVSLGLCCRIPSSPDDARLMLEQAAAALDASKQRGRNRVSAASAAEADTSGGGPLPDRRRALVSAPCLPSTR